jgi:hypothetical protein
VIWATLATAIGTGRLRYEAPLLARAFRIAGLTAATAPLFTMIYFLILGGDGVSGWYSVYGSLLGMADDATWLPMWIRICGIGIFFLLPVLIASWQLCGDLRAVSGDTRPTIPRAASHQQTGGHDHEFGSMAAVLGCGVVASALAVWLWNLELGQPYSWSGQTLWLLLWLGYLEWTYLAIWRLMPEARLPRQTGSDVSPWWWYPGAAAGLLALTITNLVIQVGSQWVVASASLGLDGLDVEFFGWFLGQVNTPARIPLPFMAVGMPLVGNAMWAGVLLWLGSARWRRPNRRVGHLLRLASLQAATTPLALGQYLTVSMLTKVERQRLQGHFAEVDLWGPWSHVMGRPVEGASPRYQATPEWLVIEALFVGLIVLPFGFFALRLSRERKLWRKQHLKAEFGDQSRSSQPKGRPSSDARNQSAAASSDPPPAG